MNAYDKLRSLPLTRNGMRIIGRLMFLPDFKNLEMKFDKSGNLEMNYIRSRAIQVDAEDCSWDFGNLLEKMYVANLMVKDEDCPRNILNRFYSYKAKVIKKLWDDGRISRVYDEGHYLCFDIEDEDRIYTFHQLKERCGDRFKIDEVRDCTVSDNKMPYNEKDIKKFQLAAVCYLQGFK